MSELSGSKITEITVNTRKLIRNGVKSTKKAAGAMKRLRRFVQKQWNTELPVYFSEDVNKKVWSRGNSAAVGRIRIRVEKGPCMMNPENKCLRVSLVDVSSFKGLQDAAVHEE